MDRVTSGGQALPAGAMAGPGTPSGGRSARLSRNPNERVLSQQEVEELKQARADREAEVSAPKGKRLTLHGTATTEVPESEVRVERLRQAEDSGDESAGGGGDAVSRDKPSGGRRLRMRALSRNGGDDQGSSPAPVARRSAAPRSDADVALSHVLAEKGFVISMQFFREGPIQQVRQAVSDLQREQELIGAIVNRRHVADQVEKCSYCDVQFKQRGEEAGHLNYQENGLMKTIRTCRNRNCIEKFNDESDQLHRARMAR